MLFFHVYNGSLLKKILFQTAYQSVNEYELSAHLICLDNSYYSNAHAVLFRVGVCCKPLLGRKGVMKNEVF